MENPIPSNPNLNHHQDLKFSNYRLVLAFELLRVYNRHKMGSPEALGQSSLRTERTSARRDALGPFLTKKTVLSRLRSTKKELSARVERREILGVATDRGNTVFPSFQFKTDASGQGGNDRLTIIEGLKDMISIFDTSIFSDRVIAITLGRSRDRLGGKSIAELHAKDPTLAFAAIRGAILISKYHLGLNDADTG